MMLILAVMSWSISEAGSFGFCLCTPCQPHQASPLISPMEEWESQGTCRGWACGRTQPTVDLVWPALTCGPFFWSRVWQLPHPAAPGWGWQDLCTAGISRTHCRTGAFKQLWGHDSTSFLRVLSILVPFIHGTSMNTSILPDNLVTHIVGGFTPWDRHL